MQCVELAVEIERFGPAPFERPEIGVVAMSRKNVVEEFVPEQVAQEFVADVFG